MKVLKWLDKNFEEKIMMVLLMAMVLISGLQVFCRYVLNNSLSWTEEITRFLFVWMTFLSIGYCIEKKISLKIDQMTNVFPATVKVVVQILVMAVSAWFFVYMIKASWVYVQKTIAGHQISSATRISMAWVQSSTIVGFTCALIRAIEQIIKDIISLRKKQSGEPEEKKEEEDYICQL